MKDRTVPPGVLIVASDPPRQDSTRAVAKWEIETSMAWEDYVKWLEARIGEYRPVRGPNGDGLLLRRRLEGDVYYLAFVPKSSGRVLTIEVTFESLPF